MISALSLFETSFDEAPRGLLALQSIYDLIPVVLFLIGSILLLRELYPKMVKGNYVLLGAGSIMVFAAGFFKALHKFLLAVARIDYTILDKQFSTTQSVGFALLAIALVGMFTPYNRNHLPSKSEDTKLHAVAFPLLLLFPLLSVEATNGSSSDIKEYTSTMPFIVLMVLGASVFLVMLIVISAKMHRPLEIVLFSLAIIFMVGMGYLSSKRSFEGAWIQISCNVCYQLCFFLGCLFLKKHGLSNLVLEKKAKAA